MEKTVLVRDIDVAELEAALAQVLAAVDRGEHDTELAQAGMTRDPASPLAGTLKVTGEQGLSPDQWQTLLVEFAPLAAAVATTVWEVVVDPALKRIFRTDRIKTDDTED